MKIAFNALPLKNENENRGVGYYTSYLLKALRALESKDFHLVEFTKDVPQDATAVHYSFFDPFFLTLPIKKRKPTIVTVHDLIPLKFPDKFPRGVKGELKWQTQKISLKMCHAIITDSQNSKKDINEITGISMDKITVIPLAAAKIFKPVIDKLKLSKVKIRFHLPEKYLLYAGDVNWNKNIEGLLTAFACLKNQDLKLVLIGNSFLDNNLAEVQKINNLADRLKVTKKIIKLGFVSSDDLSAIFNLASVYVQPSFYEGFGLPVLEALSCGCPVISAKTASLPEVGNAAVIYIDPYDNDDILRKLKMVLGDESLRGELKKKGLEQAKKFSWDKTAGETLKVYEKITGLA